MLIGTVAAPAFADTERSIRSGRVRCRPGGVWRDRFRGSPHWAVEIDSSAPSKPNVLKQTASGTFPWCVKKAVSIADVLRSEVQTAAGREDQAGGLVCAEGRRQTTTSHEPTRWRATSRSITRGGHRMTIKYVDAPVTGPNAPLRVESLPSTSSVVGRQTVHRA